jgi:hypothetical protein
MNLDSNSEGQNMGPTSGGCSEDGCSCGHHEHTGELEANFFNYVMSMGYQAMIFLGEVPNPMTGQSEKNLKQAKFLIDTLAMLRDKTKGNLTPAEEQIMTSSLYELQMKYVELSGKK